MKSRVLPAKIAIVATAATASGYQDGDAGACLSADHTRLDRKLDTCPTRASM